MPRRIVGPRTWRGLIKRLSWGATGSASLVSGTEEYGATRVSESGSQRFTKAEHLRLRRDFARVFERRRSVADDVLVVYAASNGLPYSRLGISVSKRIGNAVCRNYVRRRVREAFRLSKASLPVGFDIVCVARPQAKHRGADIEKSLGLLIPRAAKRLKERSQGSIPQ